MGFGDEKIQQVWEKGRVIPEFNPSTWRHDDYGKVIKRDEYGLQTEYGWTVDHIKPQSKGGSNALSNLRPLHWKNNAAKQDR